MDILIRNYYDGYEGEPEIQFIRGSIKGERKIISIWEGYFDDIMHQFQPGKYGWQGLAYYYNLDIGWEEDEYWEIPDLNEALIEFNSLSTEKLQFESSKNVLQEICNLICEAIDTNQNIYVCKD